MDSPQISHISSSILISPELKLLSGIILEALWLKEFDIPNEFILVITLFTIILGCSKMPLLISSGFNSLGING